MLIGSVMCDYVRMTSYDDPTGHAFRLYFEQLIEKHAWSVRDGNWLQYVGKVTDHAFCGSAIQSDKRLNHLIHVSGETANTIYPDFANYGADLVECTRFDVQLTLPMPDDFSLRFICDYLRGLEPSAWPGKQNRGRHVGPLLDDGGMDTLYIGSRESDSFIRIYVKVDDEGNYYVRFEVEMKGKRSREVFRQLRHYDLHRILAGEFDRLPSVPCDYWHALGDVLNNPHQITVPRDVVTEDSTFRWFADVVRPSLRRLLNSHEFGLRTQNMLWEILQTTDVP